MLPVGFEPTISAGERPKTYALERAATGTGTFYEMRWKNKVEPNRPQMIIRHMPIACWIPKATHTLSEYVIVIAFPLQQWLQECASV